MMMESFEQKKRRIMGKQFLPRYIKSLNKILLNTILPNAFLSIVETDAFYSQINYEKKPSIKKTILFSERKNIEMILKEHSIDFNEKYILWMEYADDCGAFKIESLNCFDFGFPYNVSKNGVITLTQVDYKYRISWDFYENNNIEYLDIELFYEIRKWEG